MFPTQSTGSPSHFGHAATNATPAAEHPTYPLPKRGRHRLDPRRNDQWQVNLPERPKEQR